MGLDESELPEDGGEVERSRRSSGVKVFFLLANVRSGNLAGVSARRIEQHHCVATT